MISLHNIHERGNDNLTNDKMNRKCEWLRSFSLYTIIYHIIIRVIINISCQCGFWRYYTNDIAPLIIRYCEKFFSFDLNLILTDFTVPAIHIKHTD